MAKDSGSLTRRNGDLRQRLLPEGGVIETHRDLLNDKQGCPACGASETDFLYEIRGIPTQSAILLDSASAAATYPTGDLELRWCDSCGIAFNSKFDESRVRYGDGYEESQGSSPTFRRYARSLSERWIEQYQLKGARALEVGCGKGEFLDSFCSISGGSGIGFDPAWDASRTEATKSVNVEYIKRNFSEADTPVDADVIICRHTLEHIQDVRGFVRLLRAACDSNSVRLVAVEVPDLRRIIEESAFWDIYYEHASYFTARGLTGLFEREGFEVLAAHRVYEDQYLILEAMPVTRVPPKKNAPRDVREGAEKVKAFSDSARATMRGWRYQFDEWKRMGKRVALWGSGSKAVGFVTSIAASDSIDSIVDINPFRNGRYMPGVPVPIVSPDKLVRSPPDCIVIMNPIYTNEISETLSALGLSPVLYTSNSVPGKPL